MQFNRVKHIVGTAKSKRGVFMTFGSQKSALQINRDRHFLLRDKFYFTLLLLLLITFSTSRANKIKPDVVNGFKYTTSSEEDPTQLSSSQITDKDIVGVDLLVLSTEERLHSVYDRTRVFLFECDFGVACFETAIRTVVQFCRLIGILLSGGFSIHFHNFLSRYFR